MKTRRTTTASVVCGLGLCVVLVGGCGDDEPPPGQTSPPANDGTDGNNGVGNDGNNGVGNNGVGNNGVNPNNGTVNNGVVNNGHPGGECAAGRVSFLSPRPGATVGAREDVDTEAAGLQIDVRLSVEGFSEGIATLSNTTLGESWGVVIEGTEVVVEGVTLEPGANRLEVVVDGPTCFVAAESVLTAEEGRACSTDSQCAWGELCEAGLCERCEATCTSDAECGGGTCVQGCACTTPWRYVMVEDLDPNATGRTPGADIDAIGLQKPNRAEVYAGRVEDSQVPQAGNDFPDVAEVLGRPDANCQVRGFVALGGLAAGGYVVVSFEEGGQPVLLDNGDVITVYEVGRLLCPNSTYLDEPYAVSVSVSTNMGTFVEVGRGGAGGNRITVMGL